MNRVEVSADVFRDVANAKGIRELITVGPMLISLILLDGERLEAEAIPYNEGVAFFRSGWE